ncbi:SDR family NAD(P)-dependent oxidoreductase [Trinickia sp. NRRL B-1857]|uniref:SDR family NAD(P)-dependent oxidoreductase n=1 Tax=Trinickia sp. NRRL B-1857 TaxID=3162879 RepID=UPI003D267F56
MIDYRLVDIDNPLVSAHRVLGQPLLPGLAYIDLIFQIFRDAGHDPRSLALRNVSIHRPLRVGETEGVLLAVACTEAQPGRWQIEITGRPYRGGAAHGEPMRYVTAQMHCSQASVFDEVIDRSQIMAAVTQTLDLEDVYARCRSLELVHDAFMRPSGQVHLTDDALYVECELSAPALSSAEHMMFHPALLDASAVAASVAASAWFDPDQDLVLGLPLFYEAFEANALLQEACIARIARSSVRHVNELSYLTLVFFDRSGRKVAQLTNLAGKRVRDGVGIADAGRHASVAKREPSALEPEAIEPEAIEATIDSGRTGSAQIESFLRTLFAQRLGQAPEEIDVRMSYYEMGIDSAGMLELVQAIEAKFAVPLSPTLLFEYVTLADLAEHLSSLVQRNATEVNGLSSVEGKRSLDDADSAEAEPSEARVFRFAESDPFLQDHRVLGQPALMGVTHPCLVLQAYVERFGARLPLQLEHIRFRGGPVTIPAGDSVQIQVDFDDTEHGKAFRVHYRGRGRAEPMRCCDGDMVGAASGTSESIDLPSLISGATRFDDERIARLYARTRAFEIGPSLRTVEAAWRVDESTQLLRIRAYADAAKDDVRDYVLDPMALCACYYLDEELGGSSSSPEMTVPLAIERIVLHRPVPKRFYVLVRMRVKRSDFAAFDASLIDEDGAVLAAVTNATLHEVKQPSTLANASFASVPGADPAGGPTPFDASSDSDIAVIGISGRYPQADDVDAFWSNLVDGVDSITEIPAERWDHAPYFDARRGQPGKTYSKWGGFMRGVDEFDPLFFHIAPAEARAMDPQERLFLQCAYSAIEDAGYTRETLVAAAKGEKALRAVGVFVGVMSQEYQLYGAQAHAKGTPMASSGSLASIANRVSYFGNFHGPSIAVDTMCSSSLTAIHLACQSLKQGQCKVAIAGGVNVTIHPNKYLMLAQGQFASSDGRCTSFGEGGDGYVPGEGVGAVVLKPLAQARADGDHIYGVIKASAINHGGKTSGYTVPNPQLQAQVIGQALRESGVPARAVTYVEAHGTGTSLGDPIEIAGLAQAFGAFTQERQFCAIGSVKSNVGHCESAAGMAGLTKVLMQMQHGQLVKSLHSDTLNPHIDFGATPFVVQHATQTWHRPVLKGDDGTEREYPLTAGLSSFGAGGANAHLIVQEYRETRIASARESRSAQGPVLVVLSARNEERLIEQAQRFAAYLERNTLDLSSLAYTLQAGREAMSARLALVVSSVDELREKLARYARRDQPIADLYRGDVKGGQGAMTAFSADEEWQEAVEKWIARGKLGKLAEVWVQGLAVPWEKLYGSTRPRRSSLPTYPFARERYWVLESARSEDAGRSVSEGWGSRLHPLVHRNSSALSGQRYSTLLTDEAPYLRDHVVRGQCVVPGVVQLEWARAAAKLALGEEGEGAAIALEQVSWLRPLIVDGELDVHIALNEEQDARIAYEIFSDEADGQCIYSRGWAVVVEAPGEALPERLDLAAIGDACSRELDAQACYARFDAAGLAYGPTLRSLRAVKAGDAVVLAHIVCPESAEMPELAWTPSILDAALQASAGLPAQADELALPFAVQAVRAWGETPRVGYAIVRRIETSGTPKLDITITDEQGCVALKLDGVSIRTVDKPAPAQTLLLAPRWEAQPLGPGIASARYAVHAVVVCDEALPHEGELRMDGADCIRLQASGSVVQRYEAYAQQLMARLKDWIARAAGGALFVQLVVPASGEGALVQGLGGLLRSARRECSQLVAQVVHVTGPGDFARRLQAEAEAAEPAAIVRDGADGREVLSYARCGLDTQRGAPLTWRDGGIYWITGGLGGLGRVFARTIAQAVREPVLVITGRGVPAPEHDSFLAELRGHGARVVYRKADVADATAVKTIADETVSRYGALHGVIHSAGVLRDGLLMHKTPEKMAQVLAPKVAGTWALDEATRDVKLDWMVLCSSAASVLGNAGQTDYAAANGFMDAYAAYREELARVGRRYGRTVSINWPLWAEGGMQVSPDVQAHMRRAMGMHALPSPAGIEALHASLRQGAAQVLVLHGEGERLLQGVRDAWHIAASTVPAAAEAGVTETAAMRTELDAPTEDPSARSSDAALAAQVERAITQLVSEHLQIAAHELERQTPFSEFGFDSIKATTFVDVLNGRYGLPLSPTALFEAPTIAALAQFLVVEHGGTLAKAFVSNEAPKPARTPAMPPVGQTGARRGRLDRRARVVPALADRAGMDAEPVAVIGISGSFPQAPDIDTFWSNLSQGRDCIGEVPSWRWGEDLAERAYPAGVLDGIDEFDPLFFGISPREAQAMDPQQRLLMTYVHKAIEDAGYSVQSLSGSATALLVGTGQSGYGQLLAGAGEAVTGSSAAGLVGSMGPNRMSYWLNWHGASEPVETACSSSLVAIHRALALLRSGECDQAVVGGVNTLLSKDAQESFGLAGMLSPEGRCKTFSARADGYVRGEGVGMLFLKPLSAARRDGDHIYGLIVGSAQNHGGRANSLTAPNPVAQARLIERAFKDAAVDPRTVGYIEAHGTGTALGDPIEIEGLRRAFNALAGDAPLTRASVGIGSVKSNIGHLELAAGVAGVIKVLLQMRHGRLVKTLNAQPLNPRIDLEGSPFYVVDMDRPWERLSDAVGMALPRRAGVSSFGFGGVNAHVVLEEYLPPDDARVTASFDGPVVAVLSARDEERLRDHARQLLAHLERTDAHLADMAYTLQVGREAMGTRLAVVVASTEQLREKLARYLRGETAIEGLYAGDVKSGQSAMAAFAADEELQEAIEKWIARGKLAKLAELWVQGLSVTWDKLYGQTRPRRLSLPTYPFARERYWVPDSAAGDRHASTRSAARLHPLVHRNTSDLHQQRYSTTLTDAAFYLRDHVVLGRHVVPGVVQLEWARAAVRLALGVAAAGSSIRLEQVSWMRPLIVDGECEIHIGLSDTQDNRVAYEIYSEQAGDVVVFSQGWAAIADGDEDAQAEWLDLAEIGHACDRELSIESCYARFEAAGLAYGSTFRGLQALKASDALALARIACPDGAHSAGLEWTPSMLDAALQASIGLAASADELALPFAVDAVRALGPVPRSGYAVVRRVEGAGASTLDIAIADEQGRIALKLDGVSIREAQRPTPVETLLMAPQWRAEALPASGRVVRRERHLIVICRDETPSGLSDRDAFSLELAEHLPSARHVFLYADGSLPQRYEAYALQLMQHVKEWIADAKDDALLVQLVVPASGEDSVAQGLGGLLRSARQEYPRLIAQVVQVCDWRELAPRLRAEAYAIEPAPVVRDDPRQRSVLLYEQCAFDAEAPAPVSWRDEGVYWITGGLGGLGRVFAQAVVEAVHEPVLVLSGRGVPTHEQEVFLSGLRERGTRVQYRQADVTDAQAMKALANEIVTRYGSLHGVIHAAGVLHDGLLAHKTQEQIAQVLRPKVAGTVALDDATRAVKLDWMVLCSSAASVLGNVGQSDYAAANGFMDAFAAYRETLVVHGDRHGRTVSVSWPLWAEGGMRVSAQAQAHMRRTQGMGVLPRRAGVDAFHRALAQSGSHVLVLHGEGERLLHNARDAWRATAGADSEQASKEPQERATLTVSVQAASLEEAAQRYVVQLLARSLKLPPQRIDAQAPLEQYGIDSVLAITLTQDLEQAFGPLSKTLFFEYQTIAALTQYFLRQHTEQLVSLLDRSPALASGMAVASIDATASGIASMQDMRRSVRRRGAAEPSGNRSEGRGQPESQSLDIAIVGLSGRYPQAESVDEYWSNLLNGVDCITEIPEQRWDWRREFDANKGVPGKSYSRWGGFLNGVDEFDPLYFNISPREAQLMDPQERLFLQCAHGALEDAGYTRAQLGEGGDVGVFVGVMYLEYQLYGAQAQEQEGGLSLGGSAASIANRVSYFGNFHGPSIAIDTMCSSSLTAIHLACQSLKQGQCKVAIAGGVNVSIHPNKYRLLSQGQFASSDGRCTSFGEGGDGYVPGEGVGAVVLKSLAQAQADGDHIYGVIKASAINHGGKTNGYTVPNPQLQSKAIADALRQSGVHPRAISYVEAHGTGTSLGDPIEIAGLTQAFGALTQDRQYCAIGSAKSNVGHCESAAGMAGLTKVLLQMKHGQLVKSLHSDTLNPHIDFSATPFVVQRSTQQWQRPVLALDDGIEREYPLTAGLSSFGAGGSNAHLIVQEYREAQAISTLEPAASQGPVVVVLSARNEDRLREQARRLHAHLANNEVALIDLAYTLQTGRDGLRVRLALVVESVAQLQEALERCMRGEKASEGSYQGVVKGEPGLTESMFVDAESREAIDAWLVAGNADMLAESWVRGSPIAWHKLYEQTRPRRLSLPTYPFARERYWAPDATTPIVSSAKRQAIAALHPMIHRNSSEFSEQRYSTVLTAEASYLRDHKVRGRHVMPGVAQLEWARAAIRLALGREAVDASIRLEQVSWIRPLIVDGELEVHIRLSEERDGRIAFEIYREQSDEATAYSQGWASIVDASESVGPEPLDVASIAHACNREWDIEAFYAGFDAAGIAYGPTFRALRTLRVGDATVLARFACPSSADTPDMQWLPSILDAALQASAGLAANADDLALPFAVSAVQAWGELPRTGYALVRRNEQSGVSTLDVTIADDEGRIALTLDGVRIRATQQRNAATNPIASESTMAETSPASPPFGDLTLAPVWEPVPAPAVPLHEAVPSRVVQLSDDLSSAIAGVPWLVWKASDTREQLIERLHGAHSFEHLVWQVSSTQAKPAVMGLKLIQALLALGYGARTLELTVVTRRAQAVWPQDGADPEQASVHGLIGSLAKEYPNWRLRLLDLPDGKHLALAELLSQPANAAGDARAWRAGRWYEQRLLPCALQVASQPAYREGGIYVVLGGAGGIGMALSDYLVRTYRAQLVWLGRRAQTEAISLQCDRLAAFGPRPVYLQVDATDRDAMDRAHASTMQRFGAIHGVVHSAIVLADRGLANMEEATFEAALSAKAATAVNLVETFGREALDFLVFFSSLQSFMKAPGQSNYAAGCCFADAYAGQLRALPYPVKVLHWGYWGSVGVVASAAYRERMTQMGFGSIEPPEAMEVLERLLAAPVERAAFVKTTRPAVALALGVNRQERVELAPVAPIVSLPPPAMKSPKQFLAQHRRVGQPTV